MKIVITVEGEKVTVEIDSKQLELPLFDPPHIATDGIEHVRPRPPYKPSAPIFKDDITEGDKLARKKEYNRKYREKQKQLRDSATENGNYNPQFKPIVPGTPEYAAATRDDSEASRKAERNNQHEIDER